MSSTVQLSTTSNFASIYCGNRPLTGIGGFPNEPTLTAANWVINFLTAPPFIWRWNRATTTFATVVGQQDYPETLANFGWLEQAATVDTSGATNQMEIALNLADDVTTNLPMKISPRLDNDGGQITFRLLPVPDKVYTVNLSYQMSSPIFTTLAQTWAPIPDYLEFLYTTGFQAKIYEFAGDEKYAFTMQLFLKMLMSVQSGLTSSQVNLFVGDFVNTQRTIADGAGTSQLGRQGRTF